MIVRRKPAMQPSRPVSSRTATPVFCPGTRRGLLCQVDVSVTGPDQALATLARNVSTSARRLSVFSLSEPDA